jgi:hypothetical protein
MQKQTIVLIYRTHPIRPPNIISPDGSQRGKLGKDYRRRYPRYPELVVFGEQSRGESAAETVDTR